MLALDMVVLDTETTRKIEDIAASIPPSSAVDTARLGCGQRKTL